MKLQYEKGDRVYLSCDFGGIVYDVFKVNKLGVTLSDPRTGETFYAGKRQIEPHPTTAVGAKWIPVEAPQ